MKSLLVSLFLLVGSTAFAHSEAACLSKATNAQLLNEIEDRLLMGGGGSSEFAFPTYTCNGRFLTINTVNHDGTEKNLEIGTSNSTDCAQFSSSMTLNKGGKISEASLVATCNGRFMTRIFIKANGEIDRLSEKGLSNSAQCKTTALSIIETK